MLFLRRHTSMVSVAAETPPGDGGTVSIDLHKGELVVTTSKEKDEGTAAA